MKALAMRTLLALVILAILCIGNQPRVLSSAAVPTSIQSAAATHVAPPEPVAATPVVAPVAASPASTVPHPANLALEPCDLVANRAACERAASELAAYGLDVEDPSPWTAFGLGRFVGAVERLADAFGGGGARAQRIARFSRALGTDVAGGRILVIWQAEPQARDGNPVRGGYAASRLYFNPNTLFLDTDTPDEARERAPEATWWPYIHELAHLWDERSAPVAQARYSARMRQWVYAQYELGIMDEYPSSYAVIGGPLEAFADSVAATVTGDAAMRDYYGSPRDSFVRATLCDAVACR